MRGTCVIQVFMIHGEKWKKNWNWALWSSHGTRDVARRLLIVASAHGHSGEITWCRTRKHTDPLGSKVRRVPRVRPRIALLPPQFLRTPAVLPLHEPGDDRERIRGGAADPKRAARSPALQAFPDVAPDLVEEPALHLRFLRLGHPRPHGGDRGRYLWLAHDRESLAKGRWLDGQLEHLGREHRRWGCTRG